MTDSGGNKLPTFESKKTKEKRVKLQSLPELDKLLNEFDKEKAKEPENIKGVEDAINKVRDEEEIVISKKKSKPKKKHSIKSKLPDFENIYDEDFNLTKEKLIKDEEALVNKTNAQVDDEIISDNKESLVSDVTEDSNIVKIEENYVNDKIIAVGDDSKTEEIDDEYDDQDYEESHYLNSEEEPYNEDNGSHDELEELEDSEELEEFEGDEEYFEDDEEDFEDDFSFLPTVNLDDEDDYDDESEEEITEEDFLYEEEYEENDDREIDEEALKNFFGNIKSKISGLFSKSKDKAPKELEKSEVNKDSYNDKKKISINKKYVIYPVIAIAIVGVLFFVVSMFGNSYSNINEVNFSAENEEAEILVEFSEFSYDDSSELISYTVYNKGEISADFFFEMEMKEKKLIPFTGSTIECESDIIALEPDGSSLETIKCNEFDIGSKYKVNVELIEVK